MQHCVRSSLIFRFVLCCKQRYNLNILIGGLAGPKSAQLVSYTGVNSAVRVENELPTRLDSLRTAATLFEPVLHIRDRLVIFLSNNCIFRPIQYDRLGAKGVFA